LNRNNALYLVIGLLAGFLGGYIGHESMSAVQPARLPPHGAAGATAPPLGGGAPPATGAAPAMAEITELTAALERDPNDTTALLRLANLNFDIQRWDRAGELYERYLALVPGDPNVLTDLGITYRARGEFQRALEMFREAQKGAPGHWQSSFNEAIVLGFDLGDEEAAQAVLSQLESRAPGNPEVARLAEELKRRREPGG